MKKQNVISEQSYSPYSERGEFCYVEGRSGTLYPGVRVENISFPLSISAVQAAVCSCLANMDQPRKIYQTGNRSELLAYWIDEFNLELRDEIPDQSNIYNPLFPFPQHPEKELERLCKQAVTIHSDFPVSALLYSEKGCIHGVNVEVGAWSLGLCAERVALSRAMASGIRQFSHIHVAAPKSEFCSPCGACRQVLNELMPKSMIYLHHNKNSLTKHFVEHLLPNGFTSGALKNR
ncbi:MAG: cytidine deaminase [Balneolaceae bacterium]|nr:MAG: cytidine deaminase [Balneolaceae bacterium]